ncbi:MAG: sigma 54-interacting transcriptional regulator [Thermoanaerobaculia bacterium]
MTQGKSDGSTAGLSGGFDPRAWRGEARSAAGIPTLTILCHPDLRRVGEWTLLPEVPLGLKALVGRNAPEFSSPQRPSGEPLADRYISREPIQLEPGSDGGVVLSLAGSRTRLEADGVPVLQTREVSAAAIEEGVPLTLSGRILLLLHLRHNVPAEPASRFGLVGESERIARVRMDIRRVADLNIPVLIRGETGTGKELVARALHDAGPRRSQPFVAVNLGALAPSLVASELFGAVKGAYTGSVQTQDGYFRRAHGGTLFLDEIGEAPPEVQVMLLRALETGEISPVGSQSGSHVDVRVLAATDSDLEEKARGGQFRAPLLHRLSGYEVWLPPLRERKEDIARLFFHFLQTELEAIGEGQRLGQELWVPPELVARLVAFDWPGNVRQLRNVTRQLAIGSRGLPRLQAGPAVERLLHGSGAMNALMDSRPRLPAASTAPPANRRRPSDVGEEELTAALRLNRWDLQATAEALQISRPSLYALIESSSTVRKAGDLSTDEIARCFEECAGDLDAMVDRLEVSRKALARRLRELRLT